MMNRYPGAAPRPVPQMMPQVRQAMPPATAMPRPMPRPAMGGPMQQPMRPPGAGMMVSDERSKQEIKRLQSANDALSKALESSHERPAGPSPERAGLDRGNPYPSHADFPDAPMGRENPYADSPAANKVAAQNVGLQAATAPAAPQAPGSMQPNPQQANFGRSQNPAFQVGNAAPDLSELDEAYRRQGMGG